MGRYFYENAPAYNPATIYPQGALVAYFKRLWIARQVVPAGTRPTVFNFAFWGYA